jgi:hypothetical protein
MKLYSYTTGKLYESEGSFTITISEKPLAADVEVSDDVTIDEKYVSREEAIDNAYQVMKEIAANEGVDEDDVDCVETQDEFVCTVPDYKEWTFKLNGILDEPNAVNDVTDQNDVDDVPYESVASRFSKYRKMFESDVVINDDGKYTGINEEDESDVKDDDDKKDDDTDEKKDGDDDTKDKKDDEGDEDDEEMKAILLTVKKGDEDACKEELIDAGISEDDITILDADEDDENVDIRVEPSAAFELKDYLAGKGIDLEEKIGGEIVDDSESDDDEKDGEGDEGGDDNLDDFDFDNLGDIFGADEDEKK